MAQAGNGNNSEIVVGDVLALTCFCLYKQIMAITMLPSFQGWAAPIAFNPLRFYELFGFVITVAGTWAGTSYLHGDYSAGAQGAQHFAAIAGIG